METAQMPAFTPEAAVEQFGDTVFRAAFGLVKNPQDAEDIAQEVFLNLVRHAPQFDSAEHQKAWLLRCTINRCKSHFRSAWVRRSAPLEQHGLVERDGTRLRLTREGFLLSNAVIVELLQDY